MIAASLDMKTPCDDELCKTRKRSRAGYFSLASRPDLQRNSAAIGARWDEPRVRKKRTPSGQSRNEAAKIEVKRVGKKSDRGNDEKTIEAAMKKRRWNSQCDGAG